MKDLNLLSKQELENFFNSFDRVLCDIDGVLWLFLEKIPGAIDGIKALGKLNKKVTFVSNNTSKPFDVYLQQLRTAGLDVGADDLIVPQLAMISHLKKHNFDKEIYLIGMTPLRTELEAAGFTVLAPTIDHIGETVQDLAKHSCVDNENVGAVISDIDININYIKLQRAVTYLRRPDVMFLTGAMDCKAPIGLNRVVVGPGYFHKILEDITGRKSDAMAKPSPLLHEYILAKLKIQDCSRVLFIGDSVSEDMGFATICGYKKLLVLSGLTNKKDSLTNWTHPDEYKPDYYADSLNIVYKVISENFDNRS